MQVPAVPDGYVVFPDILRVLYVESDPWQVTAMGLDAALAEYPRDPRDVPAALAGLQRWVNSPEVFEGISGAIGARLAGGTTRAAGIDEYDGRLVWVPPEAWRLLVPDGLYGDRIPAARAAFLGLSILVPDRIGMKQPCFPVLSKRELATAFGAQQPPAPPELQPKDFEPQTAAAPPPPEQPAPKPQAEAQPPQTPPDAKSKGKGGRLPAPYWDDFWIEVAIRAYVSGLEEEKRSGLQKHMEEWSSRRWGDDGPDEKAIRKKLALLFARVTRET